MRRQTFSESIAFEYLDMPSILCRCGEVLRYGEIPNPIEWLFISDKEYDECSEKIDAEELYRKMRSILECSACGRIYMFWDGFKGLPSCYVPES